VLIALVTVFSGNSQSICAGHDWPIFVFEHVQDEAEQCMFIVDCKDAIT
jgi:hypothetical protein